MRDAMRKAQSGAHNRRPTATPTQTSVESTSEQYFCFDFYSIAQEDQGVRSSKTWDGDGGQGMGVRGCLKATTGKISSTHVHTGS